MLAEITRRSVEAAIDEFDSMGRDDFLSKYGFGRARSYFLLVNGRRYDSKAICGAAHGFAFPDQGPLGPQDFSGGNATVARVLESLDFEVVRPTTSRSGWAEEERILALDLYLRFGLIGRTHPEVLKFSEELNRRAFHPDAGKRENFRNVNGVALKLANFASLDPSYMGKGMSSFSQGDEETWDLYSGDVDLLTEAVVRIRAGEQPSGTGARIIAGPVGPKRRPIEERHVDSYEVTRSTERTYARRREAELVEHFASWLRNNGAEVNAHHYDNVMPPMRSDVADETACRIWEAKADVGRSSVRMALGQLIDYLRFEPSHWTGGVLLPNRPSDDLLMLVRTARRSIAWPDPAGSYRVLEP